MLSHQQAQQVRPENDGHTELSASKLQKARQGTPNKMIRFAQPYHHLNFSTCQHVPANYNRRGTGKAGRWTFKTTTTAVS